MDTVCHVISDNHLNKGLNNFVGGSRSSLVGILPSLVTIGTVVVEI